MPLRVSLKDTAADTDVLATSDLETMPGPGVLQVWMASTVDTATVTATMGPGNIGRSLTVPLRSNGQSNIDQDPPLLEEAVLGGEKPVLNLGGTTGTVLTLAVFTPADEF